LDSFGRLENETDLHATVANFGAVSTFIAKEAGISELWNLVVRFHDIFSDQEGKEWLNKRIKNHPYIVAAIIFQVQQITSNYVKIANNLEYRLAVQQGKTIDPRAYQEANERSRHVIVTMKNLLQGAGVGHLEPEPAACKNFYIEDQATKDRNRAEHQALQRSTNQRSEGRNTGTRRDEARDTNSRSNNRTNNSGNNTAASGGASTISDEQVVILKRQGLIKWTGTGSRVPPIPILEMNGSSGLSRICMPTIVQGKYCRWGDACKQKHIKRLGDFTAPNKVKFVAYVQAQGQVELAQSGTNA
jgi:hypothetical protein